MVVIKLIFFYLTTYNSSCFPIFLKHYQANLILNHIYRYVFFRDQRKRSRIEGQQTKDLSQLVQERSLQSETLFAFCFLGSKNSPFFPGDISLHPFFCVSFVVYIRYCVNIWIKLHLYILKTLNVIESTCYCIRIKTLKSTKCYVLLKFKD